MRTEQLIDWTNFTKIDTEDPREVIRDILGLDADLFQEGGYVRGYHKCLAFEHIFVGYDGWGFAKGVCVSMSGQGCREYEALGGDFAKLWEVLHVTPNINVTQFHLACDIYEGSFDMRDVEKHIDGEDGYAVRTHCVFTDFVKRHRNGNLAGQTAYIGNYKKSDMFVRIYDKAKELYSPTTQPELYNTPRIRLEIVFKKQYAKNALNQMVNQKHISEYISEVLNGFFSFVEKDDSNLSRCSLTPWWAEFLQSLEKVKLWCKGEIKHSIERTVENLRKQYAPTIAMLYKALGVVGFHQNIVADGRARMTEKHHSILRNYEVRRDMLMKLRGTAKPQAAHA